MGYEVETDGFYVFPASWGGSKVKNTRGAIGGSESKVRCNENLVGGPVKVGNLGEKSFLVSGRNKSRDHLWQDSRKNRQGMGGENFGEVNPRRGEDKNHDPARAGRRTSKNDELKDFRGRRARSEGLGNGKKEGWGGGRTT